MNLASSPSPPEELVPTVGDLPPAGRVPEADRAGHPDSFRRFVFNVGGGLIIHLLPGRGWAV